MRWKRYAYWASIISLCLVVVIALVMDWGGPISTDPLSWGNIFSLLGLGIPMVFVGLDWMLTPEDFLNWLARHMPLNNPPKWTIRFFGCSVALTGVLPTAIGMSMACKALGIHIS